MATGTPSPTPSEDNRQNNRDDTMYSALDKVMGNSVQTYDDFLNSFTFLKKGMQEKEKDKTEKASKSTDKKNRTGETKINTSRPSLQNKAKMENKEGPVMSTESHGIEEEILCEGDTTSRISKTKVIRTGSLVKFDNFVDPVADGDDDVEDIVDISVASYAASFSTGVSTRNSGTNEKERGVTMVTETAHTIKDSSSNLHGNSDVTNMFNTQLSLDENSTDKLLLNFLADLQNEQNEKFPVNTSKESSSEMDIQNFLHKNKKPKKALPSKSEEVVSESEEVNFNDDDDGDAINLLCDDSETNEVNVKITEEDLKKMKVSDEKAKARLDDIYRSSLRDSEGNVQIVRSDENVSEHGSVSDAIDYDKLVFPGQVEEMSDEPAVENDRLLDFKAIFRESSPNTDQEGESTDMVHPFKLDEDFDYDNVVLTPKFSSEDLRQIKLTVKTQTVVM